MTDAVRVWRSTPFDDAFLAARYARHEAFRDAGPVVWPEAIGACGLGVPAGAPERRLNNTLRAISRLPVEVVRAP